MAAKMEDKIFLHNYKPLVEALCAYVARRHMATALVVVLSQELFS